MFLSLIHISEADDEEADELSGKIYAIEETPFSDLDEDNRIAVEELLEDNINEFMTYQFAAGGLVMVVWGLVGGGRIGVTQAGPAGIGMLCYLAFISAAAYTLWSLLLKYNPVSRVAVYGFMNPVFGVILSAWLLAENDQAFGVKTAAALGLVCLGIYVVNRPRAASAADSVS